MAACYNKKLINHMILVMEPCEFTYNYFLHQLVTFIFHKRVMVLKYTLFP